jgi:hypothetical protein
MISIIWANPVRICPEIDWKSISGDLKPLLEVSNLKKNRPLRGRGVVFGEVFRFQISKITDVGDFSKVEMPISAVHQNCRKSGNKNPPTVDFCRNRTVGSIPSKKGQIAPVGAI